MFVVRDDPLRARSDSARTIWFVGVVAAVFFRQETNQIVSAPIPASHGGDAVVTEMIDLGLILKAESVRELADAFVKRWLESERGNP